jgi:hypothetical protein
MTGEPCGGASGDAEIAVLGAGDFDVAIADDVGRHRDGRAGAAIHQFIESGGEHAGLEASAP